MVSSIKMNVLLFFAAPLAESPPAAAPAGSLPKTTPAASLASQDASSLVNLLSKVEVSPADLLSALSKVQGQGSLHGRNKKSLFENRNFILCHLSVLYHAFKATSLPEIHFSVLPFFT